MCEQLPRGHRPRFELGGPVSGVIATMGDLGAPVAAFPLILTIGCAVTTLVAGFLWFGRYQKSMRAALADGRITQEEIAHATGSNGWSITFAFGLVATCVLALVLAAQAAVKKNDGGPERGLVATVLPPLQTIQDSLFNIEKQVTQINTTTQETRASTQRTEEQTTGLAANREGHEGGHHGAARDTLSDPAQEGAIGHSAVGICRWHALRGEDVHERVRSGWKR